MVGGLGFRALSVDFFQKFPKIFCENLGKSMGGPLGNFSDKSQGGPRKFCEISQKILGCTLGNPL